MSGGFDYTRKYEPHLSYAKYVKRGLGQTDRNEAVGMTPVKAIDQIFKKSHLDAAMFQYSGKKTFLIDPFTGLARKMPLPDYQEKQKYYDRDYQSDKDIDRKLPSWI